MPMFRVEREVRIYRTEYYEVEADSFDEASENYWEGDYYDYDDGDEDTVDVTAYCQECDSASWSCECQHNRDPDEVRRESSEFFAGMGL